MGFRRPLLPFTLAAALLGCTTTEKHPGFVTLNSGLKARLDYYFDRNALQDSRHARNSIVGLTVSGNLLLFDATSLNLKGERIGNAAAVCLGQSISGDVWVGFEDGTIDRVDPENLGLIRAAHVSGKPRWVGGSDEALIVVAEPLQAEVTEEGTALRLHDISLRRSWPLAPASTFFLDSRRRLWWGRDRGEWGGACGVHSLETGLGKQIDGHWSGVYGLTELPDGSIIAFGGTLHMGLKTRFVARLDPGGVERIHSNEDGYPVTHVFADPSGDGLLVFSFGEIAKVDFGFKRWKPVASTRLRYSWGRPDAMGSYPAVKGVHLLHRIVCSTGRDGLVEFKGATQTDHRIPNQLALHGVATILPTDEGTLLLDDRGSAPPLRRVNERWETIAAFPAAPPRDGRDWYEFRLLTRPDGSILPIFRENSFPGLFAVGRRRGGQSYVDVPSENSLGARSTFLTPNGRLWSADGDKLFLLADGRWAEVGTSEGTTTGIRVGNQTGPPWILHAPHPFEEKLFELSETPAPRLKRMALGDIQVYDARAWSRTRLALATNLGLRFYESGKLLPWDLPVPPASVRVICRDGLARIWVGGSGLWLLEGSEIRGFDELPPLGGADIVALEPDPDHADGVIVSLGSRGVAYVRAYR